MLRTLALLAIVGTAAGQDRVYPTLRLPARLDGEAGQDIAITAETNGRLVRWLCQDDPHALRPGGDKGTVARFASPGNYRVWAWTAVGDFPSSAQFVYLVIRPAGPTPPDPPPVPPTPPNPPPPPSLPTPPTPVDPWAAELQAAYGSDPGDPADKAKKKAALSGFYAAMADHVANEEIKTVGDLLSDYTKAKAALKLDAGIPATRRAAGLKAADAIPADPETPLDKPLRDKIANAFTRLALSLDQVK
jgi:hypothetical protein